MKSLYTPEKSYSDAYHALPSHIGKCLADEELLEADALLAEVTIHVNRVKQAYEALAYKRSSVGLITASGKSANETYEALYHCAKQIDMYYAIACILSQHSNEVPPKKSVMSTFHEKVLISLQELLQLWVDRLDK